MATRRTTKSTRPKDGALPPSIASDVMSQLRAWSVDVDAARELLAYQKTGNGAHVIRAFLAYRRAGLAIPENILAWLDARFASLLRARTPDGRSIALELSTPKGGASSDTRAEQTLEQRRLLECIASMLEHRDHCRGLIKSGIAEIDAICMLVKVQTGRPPTAEHRTAIEAQVATSHLVGERKNLDVIAIAAAQCGYSTESAKQLWYRSRRRVNRTR